MLRKIRSFYDARHGTSLLLLILGLAVLACSNRFVQDDAFISFRYADNLVHGKGLVWNEGERVEGYTNFLWTLAMVVPHLLGIDPVRFSAGIGLAAFVLSLLLTYRLATRVLRSQSAALLAVLLVGTNHTFSSYATGGLETQWQACIFSAAALLLLPVIQSSRLDHRRLAALSFLLGIAVLTRIDSVVLVFWTCAIVGWLVFFRRDTLVPRGASLAAALVPFFVIMAAWFVWKLSYYGAPLPNTFYAKEPTPMHAARGIYYVAAFLAVYWLAPFAILFPVLLKNRWPRADARGELVALAALVFLWSLYVISVGGDFMEFRFMVPIMPCGFVLVTWTILESARARILRFAFAVLVIFGSLFESRLPALRGVQTIDGLSQPVPEWRYAGEVLGKSFGGDRGIVIATTAAGTIPYYSRLKTIDMTGLCDEWVARNGMPVTAGFGFGPKIGHQRLATLQYLLERRVNLVIAHPWIERSSHIQKSGYSVSDLRRWSASLTPEDANQEQGLLAAKIVAIPLQSDRRLLALYLVHSSAVDDAIRTQGWTVHPISRD